MLVFWYFGMLVSWYAGMLICWYAGMLVSVSVMTPKSIGPPEEHLGPGLESLTHQHIIPAKFHQYMGRIYLERYSVKKTGPSGDYLVSR